MPTLTETEIKRGYFHDIGGFPPLNSTDDRTNFAREVKDYKGQDKLCIVCTQLDYEGYSERDKKRVLTEWIDFLQSNTKTFKALHFNSRVPQQLFDAACCQENLEELRFKWGAYKDISALQNLRKLRFLYIGSGASVQSISVLGKLEKLIVLYVTYFKNIEDYSPLGALNELEQLTISGTLYRSTPVKDFEFLREINNLISLKLINVSSRRKYTPDEIDALWSTLHLRDI